jgi:hypothetical protein
MRLSVLMGLGVALAVVSTSAFAFQEQQSGGAAAPAAPAAAPPAAQEPAAAGMDLTTPAPSEGATAGTEVRIPGLGKLGVLPKMDFGLELLYGANESKQPDAVEREAPADDLTIRGTVKHNF